jgi:hypothetical protein
MICLYIEAILETPLQYPTAFLQITSQRDTRDNPGNHMLSQIVTLDTVEPVDVCSSSRYKV